MLSLFHVRIRELVKGCSIHESDLREVRTTDKLAANLIEDCFISREAKTIGGNAEEVDSCGRFGGRIKLVIDSVESDDDELL